MAEGGEKEKKIVELPAAGGVPGEMVRLDQDMVETAALLQAAAGGMKGRLEDMTAMETEDGQTMRMTLVVPATTTMMLMRRRQQREALQHQQQEQPQMEFLSGTVDMHDMDGETKKKVLVSEFMEVLKTAEATAEADEEEKTTTTKKKKKKKKETEATAAAAAAAAPAEKKKDDDDEEVRMVDEVRPRVPRVVLKLLPTPTTTTTTSPPPLPAATPTPPLPPAPPTTPAAKERGEEGGNDEPSRE
jgi:hypothetical protein